MGSLLSEPLTEKTSTDETNDKLLCGASSMQGWRVTQEDAHNCLLDFDTNTSFFAVYDGHGGHEVAKYCSDKLPQFIKDCQAYKDGDISKALIDGFLGFDATIATKDVIAVLTEIAGEKKPSEESDEEENVDNLYKEAFMPIEQVIEKYRHFVDPSLKNLKKEDGKLAASPKTNDNGECSSSGPSNSQVSSECTPSSSSEEAATPRKETAELSKTSESEADGVVSEVSKEVEKAVVKDETVISSEKAEGVPLNGEITVTSSTTEVQSSTPQENGDVSKKGKGKKIAPVASIKTRPKRNAIQLYQNLLNNEDSEEESEDEDDKTFEGPNEDSSDDDDEGVNQAIEVQDSDDDASSGEEEEDIEEEEDDEDDLEFARNMKEQPGSNSGCTAVVALLKGNELYVANAGDSRCIVCRKGKAIDMSIDHKPEDELERERIVKAGGKVTYEGRVNGGLNLSRAIGDHAYKQNKDLSDREQMITALPDIKTLTINPAEDEFLVLACDGIWNFMSSQEVVDFVRPRIEENAKLSTICEEMFDHCLAPDTLGDGTGCDNMTAIIVRFKTNILKRSASSEAIGSCEVNVRRAKTEDNSASMEEPKPV
ncbi:unnamed protein product [Phyllotreta striolata]|uniref:protein-serine/threonine phosphatase n=1 Tax=Phyllotreta striolata TaxID=444603 RepID=A0A9N9XT06_PHYSR|nr:unnamed protein product [Phyllotreta striolata]